VKPTEKAQEKQDKPVEKAAEKSIDKSSEPSEDKPAETASIPVETRSHGTAPREKTAIRTIPLTVPAVQPAVSAVVAPNPPPTVEAAVSPEEHRDANDLARAAIERLRGSNGASPRVQEAIRTPESPRIASVPQTPALRPLPPPIMVSTPPADSFGPAAGPSPVQPYSYSASARNDDPRRPTPPADIPPARPLDLNAGGSADPSAREHTNVAEDMLLAAKSMFHSVLPQ
jgi:hypothetical protein